MRSVTVVGSGLAGMTAALRLLQRGFQVTIFDAAVRLGGKAGANAHGVYFDDHGYHIFPVWYLNTWQLVQELGIREHFVDRSDFRQLAPGAFPQFRTLRNISSPRFLWTNLMSGVLSVPEMILLYYFGIDLMAEPLKEKALLDQVTVNGFIRSRFYRTEALALQCQDLILKGISTPSYYASAMTMRTLMMFWARYPEPMFRILSSNLQESFIGPLEQRLRDLGCVVNTGQRLERFAVKANRVERLCLRDIGTGRQYEAEIDQLILAIPAERVAEIIDSAVYAASPNLASVRYLHSRSMAALDIYLNVRIPNLPKDHINLLGSRFGLSLIDVSQVWQGYDTTVLNVIASDFTSLETVSSEEAVEQLLADLKRYIPDLEPGSIRRVDFQSHIDAPLLTNEVAIWHWRPETTTAIANLFLAGDYCRTHVDLVCMEGAVVSGLQAAAAICQVSGMSDTVSIEKPAVYPRWMWLLGRYGLMPIAAIAKLATLMTRT